MFGCTDMHCVWRPQVDTEYLTLSFSSLLLLLVLVIIVIILRQNLAREARAHCFSWMGWLASPENLLFLPHRCWDFRPRLLLLAFHTGAQGIQTQSSPLQSKHFPDVAMPPARELRHFKSICSLCVCMHSRGGQGPASGISFLFLPCGTLGVELRLVSKYVLLI